MRCLAGILTVMALVAATGCGGSPSSGPTKTNTGTTAVGTSTSAEPYTEHDACSRVAVVLPCRIAYEDCSVTAPSRVRGYHDQSRDVVQDAETYADRNFGKTVSSGKWLAADFGCLNALEHVYRTAYG